MQYTFRRPSQEDIKEFETIAEGMRAAYIALLTGKVEKKTVVSYLENLIQDQRPVAWNVEMGGWGIWDPADLPTEARIDFFHLPTYLAASIMINSLVQFPMLSMEIPDLLPALGKALLASTDRKLQGHGYDALDGELEAMRIFAQAGTTQFLKSHPQICPEFSRMYQSTLDRYRRKLASGDTEGHFFSSLRDYREKFQEILELAEEKEQAILVFVYGTLMRGHGNHSLLSEFDHTGYPASLSGYSLYQVAGFPGIVAEDEGIVLGEVYQIDAATLERLDWLEGEGSMYLRKRVRVDFGKEVCMAYIYVWNSSVDPATRIPLSAQPWRKAKDLVWYACYGANTNIDYLLNRYIAGCGDRTPPLVSRPCRIPHQLYFGNHSPRWDGMGVAFLDTERNETVGTLGRMYLLKAEQFQEIQVQEGQAWYDRVLDLGLEDGVRILSFTHSTRYPDSRPCERYVITIVEGLRQTWEMADEEIDAYLQLH